jgi:acylphosphatase
VEIVAEGPEEALKSFLRWAGHGPSGARVDNLSARWEAPRKSFSAFEIGW